MIPKYMVHLGWVKSISDGDLHYISAVQLVRLYNLRPEEYVLPGVGRSEGDYINLYPRFDGNYTKPVTP